MDIQINYSYFTSIFIAVIIIFIIVVIIIVIIIIIITIIVILELLNWWRLTQMFHVISPTTESITARVEKICKFLLFTNKNDVKFKIIIIITIIITITLLFSLFVKF